MRSNFMRSSLPLGVVGWTRDLQMMIAGQCGIWREPD